MGEFKLTLLLLLAGLVPLLLFLFLGGAAAEDMAQSYPCVAAATGGCCGAHIEPRCAEGLGR